ncbi:HMG box-containing protein 1-like isoform X2 [Eriocheir sinensis]|uniref:HMG box-containing protein 1-like isoform X2 n=1 Tax=Eriocheir sinensis TaxID=95602 RepID=UPI0021C98F80|nr:HMG box-containing protein 1-like isoform X2 [Eriocheir sinensis]
MNHDMKEERMSPVMMGGMCPDAPHPPSPEEPRDLSIKRKLRPVPPPLDLSKRNLEPEAMIPEFTAINTTSPRSPLTQKSLPLRKRAHSWSFQLEVQGLQLPANASQGVIRCTAEIRDQTTGALNSSSSSSSSSLRIPGLPTPHTPHTPHPPHSAIPVITSRFPFSEGNHSEGNTGAASMGHGDLSGGAQGPLNLSTGAVSGLPSSLLSPAPSHPSTSSLNSSREELENEVTMAECHAPYSHAPSPHMPSPHMPSPHLMSPHPHLPMGPQGLGGHGLADRLGPGSSPCPASMSPQPTSGHQWPTNVWSVFMSGVRVHFVLGGGGQVTGAKMSEELGQLERTHQQRYAPHGLHLMRILHEGPTPHISAPSYCQLYFRPVVVQQEDIMVVTPPDHPFYVHGKGWCSVFPERTTERYSLPCQQLQEGDVCLPPYHPETTQTPIPVVTPDLTDAMKRFDFNDDPLEGGAGAYSAPPSATFPPHTHRTVFLSPPASPSKKNREGARGGGGGASGGPPPGSMEGAGVRARRPMNGFMLFAKHHRLKLIQQYPGKDNRAISVLLGVMWKSLPEEDRETFNAEARAQAEERKKIDPDCWKRKRSHSTS